ncbi:hypothetical protein FO519_003843 [Halicephalobus sp. NKZ332]|nr:hypothetical protein FO519_003843 [Halicephalobus sp. NKZ332]
MAEETKNELPESASRSISSRKVKIFLVWILSLASGVYFGYVLAKSTYSSVHAVCGTNKHPDELMKNECFFQLVGRVLQYEYDSIFISRVADEKGTPHIIKISMDYSKRVDEAKDRFIDEFFKRQKLLLIEPTLILTALLGSSIATLCLGNEEEVNQNPINPTEEEAMDAYCTESVDEIYSNALSKKHAKPVHCKDFATDCNTKIRLCDNHFYSRIMERFCQKTCGFCGSPSSRFRKKTAFKKIKPRPVFPSRKVSTKNTRIRSRVRGASTVNTGICLDLGVDCNEKRSLCTHRTYATLMKKMCMKTCNLCDTN